MTTDQPNLQAILWYNFQNGCNAEDVTEAIDAIYAALLAEVIGEDVIKPSGYHPDVQDAEERYKNKLRAEQRESLKRWCYGENASNDTQGAE